MHIVFDPDFDSGAWPGPLTGRDAAGGEAWSGPTGFLEQLETRLGLGGPRASPVERIASVLTPVRQVAGFWSRSAQADVVETAAALLRWRDLLWTAGWRGQPVTRRLEELAKVTADVPPGFADRLGTVLQTLPHRSPGIASVKLFQELDRLPSAWQRILQDLRTRGSDIRIRRLEPQPAPSPRRRGDLSSARVPGFTPHGDGSLQLLRPYGPLQAAEEVAAWLAAQDRLEKTVVIGADPVLDAALHRHGLPTVGAASTRHSNLLFQLLPLVLDLGWHPADPQRALELLTVPLNPIPAGLARHLIRALSEWPAVDSDAWREQLDRGLADVEDEDRRRARRRVEMIFRPAAPYGGRYPSGEIRDRAGIVQEWLQIRSASTEGDPLPWQSAIHQCSTLIRLLDHARQDDFTAPQLQCLLELAARDLCCLPSIPQGGRTAPARPLPDQVGCAAVGRPGAVTGGARRIIWWDFSSGSVPPLETLPLCGSEIDALAKLDVHLPDRGREAEILGERWRRPLLAARDTLLLVCPHKAEDGEDLFPHPLWDEVCANLERRELTTRLEHTVPISHPPAPRKAPRLDALPELRRLWSVPPRSIARRDKESPSSGGTLIGCSFKWVSEYAGRLRPGLSQAIPDERRALGNLAHAVLEKLLETDVPRPAQAEQRAGEIFDRDASRSMASLYLPGADAHRAMARRTICEAARVLCAHLVRYGRRVLAVESARQRQALGTAFEGRPDLLIGPSPAVIDFKWSGGRYHRDSLTRGSAYQLACYSYLVAEGRDHQLPPVAYFVLRDQKLISTDPDAFPGAERVNGPAVAQAWRAFERAHAAAWERLQAGELEAPWPLAETAEDALVNGVLTLKPPCRFCNLAALCGAAFMEPS